MKLESSNLRTSRFAHPPAPLLPLTPVEEHGVVASLKRPRIHGNSPLNVPALGLHSSVGIFPVDYAMHAVHRDKLVTRMRGNVEVPARSVLLFRGGVSAMRDETDHEQVFRQESTFNYLFGIRDPDCFATIELSTGEATLYIPRLPSDYVIWMGEVLPPSHFEVGAHPKHHGEHTYVSMMSFGAPNSYYR